jgi:hypothetical protein
MKAPDAKASGLFAVPCLMTGIRSASIYPMKGISFKAVFIGVAIDFGLSLGVGLVLGIGLGIALYMEGVPPGEIASRLDLSHSLSLLLMSLVLGGIAIFIGGFVTGWIAKFYEVKNALLAGLVSTVLSCPFLGGYPAWYDVAAVLFTIVPSVLGGYVAKVIFDRGSKPA